MNWFIDGRSWSRSPVKALSRSSRGVPTSALTRLQSLKQVTAGQPNSVSLFPERTSSSPKVSFTRPKTLDQHSFVKHFRARAAAAPRPLEPRIRSMCPAGWIFATPLGDVHPSCIGQLLLPGSSSWDGRNGSVEPPLHDQQRKARSTCRGHTTRTTPGHPSWPRCDPCRRDRQTSG